MNPNNPPPQGGNNSSARSIAIVAIVCLLAMLIFIIVRPRTRQSAATPADVPNTFSVTAPMAATHSGLGLDVRQPHNELPPLPARPAAEIVAEKVSQFARNREELVAAMAKHFNVAVPDEVNRFFAAVQAGNWPETTNLFAFLRQNVQGKDRLPGLEKLWAAILETYGAAEQTRLWPAQKLLDYGNAVLDSLRPGMIYVGGTDEGRFIPTLLTETSEGEHHIVLTQNALADGTYLEYLRFQYGDKLNTLTDEESENAFKTYLTNVQMRLQLNELRPGEDVQVKEGRVEVSGQTAVMAINEILLKTLLQKNPDASFALQESFPFKSLYTDATTLGPITELRATDTASALTPERAAQSLDYWRSTTQNILADADAAASSTTRDNYAKLILGQAGLFADRKLPGEAEQAYKLANSLSPGNPEAVFPYVQLLMQQKRLDEARKVAQTAVNNTTDAVKSISFGQLVTRLNEMK